MEMAKISSKGQITIPIEIRKKLKLKEGDKVLFIMEGDKIIFANASIIALEKIQQDMIGEAEKNKIYSEEDVMQLVKEVRKEIRENKNEDND